MRAWGVGVGCGFEVWGSCEVCGGCVRWEGREIIEILCEVEWICKCNGAVFFTCSISAEIEISYF